MRKLLRVDLLVIDDFALQSQGALDTADVYELIVERQRTAATVVTRPGSLAPTPRPPVPLALGLEPTPGDMGGGSVGWPSVREGGDGSSGDGQVPVGGYPGRVQRRCG